MDFLLLAIGISILYMIGGQFLKGARRFGVPGLIFLYNLKKFLLKLKTSSKKDGLISLVFTLLIPFLSAGYGVNSFLMKIFKNDTVVRIVYALGLSIPYGAYIYLSHDSLLKYLGISISLVLAFLVRAGSLGRIGKYDILIEDIVRSQAIAWCYFWLIH